MQMLEGRTNDSMVPDARVRRRRFAQAAARHGNGSQPRDLIVAAGVLAVYTLRDYSIPQHPLRKTFRAPDRDAGSAG